MLGVRCWKNSRLSIACPGFFSRKCLRRKLALQNNHQHTKLPSMAKRRVKKRTHVGAAVPKNTQKPNDGSPKSMVIRVGAGEVGSSVSQLVKDMRLVMEPGTAARLKVENHADFSKRPF